MSKYEAKNGADVYCEAQRSHFVVISVKIKERIKIPHTMVFSTWVNFFEVFFDVVTAAQNDIRKLIF